MRLFKDRFLLAKFVIVFALLAIAGSSFAISLPNNEIGQTVSISVRPEYPGPFEDVLFALSSPSFDVNTAEISWVTNGVLSAKGIGSKNFSIQMGPVGSRSRIDIVIKPLGRDSFSKSFDLYPTSIDLLWQANTYTPPFFEGKAKHTTEGAVTVVAIPSFAINGKMIPKEELVYQWTNNGHPMSNSSGYGKYSVTIRNNFIKTKEEVSVGVSTPDKTIFSTKKTMIPVEKPEIVFYEDHSLYGTLFNSGIVRETNLLGKEMSFAVAPYLFAVDDPTNPRLVYTWLVNGASGQVGDSREKLTFRNESEDSGQTRVGLKIIDGARVISFAENDFLIDFGNSTNQ